MSKNSINSLNRFNTLPWERKQKLLLFLPMLNGETNVALVLLKLIGVGPLSLHSKYDKTKYLMDNVDRINLKITLICESLDIENFRIDLKKKYYDDFELIQGASELSKLIRLLNEIEDWEAKRNIRKQYYFDSPNLYVRLKYLLGLSLDASFEEVMHYINELYVVAKNHGYEHNLEFPSIGEDRRNVFIPQSLETFLAYLERNYRVPSESRKRNYDREQRKVAQQIVDEGSEVTDGRHNRHRRS